jgi:hypothetical protein
MATLPFFGPIPKPRRPLTGARLVIVASACAFLLFLIWAALAPVDEVTRGQGRVIPSSKVQIIQAAAPATLSELLVRGGERVHKGQLLARLEDPQSSSELGQIQAETESLEARAQRLQAEANGGTIDCTGPECHNEIALRAARQAALQSKVAGLHPGLDEELVAQRHHLHDLLAGLNEPSDRGDLDIVHDTVDGGAQLVPVELALGTAQRLFVHRDLRRYLAMLVESLLAEGRGCLA